MPLAQELDEVSKSFDDEKREKIEAKIEELNKLLPEFKKTVEDYTKKGFLKKMFDRKKDARSFKKNNRRMKRLFGAIKDLVDAAFKSQVLGDADTMKSKMDTMKSKVDTVLQDRKFRLEDAVDETVEAKVQSDGVDETTAGLALQQDQKVLMRVASKGLVSVSRYHQEVIEPSSTREWLSLEQVKLTEYEPKIVGDEGYGGLADLVDLSADGVKQLCAKVKMKPDHTNKFTRLLSSIMHEHAGYLPIATAEITVVLSVHIKTVERRRQARVTNDGTSRLMDPTAASLAARKGRGSRDTRP